ncbi:hypothetical protein GCM10010360_37820 [Streptomyces nogalater]
MPGAASGRGVRNQVKKGEVSGFGGAPGGTRGAGGSPGGMGGTLAPGAVGRGTGVAGVSRASCVPSVSIDPAP